MTEIILRPAKKSDAADLAILDNIAGHGISHWFWQGAVSRGEAEDAYEWGRSRFASDEVFGWRNSTVAERDEQILGSVTSYVMPEPDEEYEDIKMNAKPFVPVFELFAEVAGNWFIDSLAVYQTARGTGVGSRLFDDSLNKGQNTGSSIVNLVCEDSNAEAIRLYKKRGFREVDWRPYISFGGSSPTQKWMLMELKF